MTSKIVVGGLGALTAGGATAQLDSTTAGAGAMAGRHRRRGCL